jgi:hypothetical protein
MTLIGHGVPWEIAWAMEDWELLAAMVAIGEANGGKFDWDRVQWKEVIRAETFARCVRAYAPHLRDVDIETIEVIGRLCDPSARIEREHVQALGIAFLNAMRERSQMLKLIQRQPR